MEANHLRGKRVLLVEDDALFRGCLARSLRSEGLDVSEAENGRNALQRLSTGRFDLAITDINMPVMGGIQFLRQARKDHDLPILLMTGLRDPISPADSTLPAHSACLTKPFSREDLFKGLAAALCPAPSAAPRLNGQDLLNSAEIAWFLGWTLTLKQTGSEPESGLLALIFGLPFAARAAFHLRKGERK